MDVLLTLLLFLAWTHHTGALAPDAFATHVETIRATLALERWPGWAEVARELEGWGGVAANDATTPALAR
jgi:hypothetical protein